MRELTPFGYLFFGTLSLLVVLLVLLVAYPEEEVSRADFSMVTFSSDRPDRLLVADVAHDDSIDTLMQARHEAYLIEESNTARYDALVSLAEKNDYGDKSDADIAWEQHEDSK